ncbi:histidine kinase dimerization/phospho-acceptor domain-containing protein [Parerythrobacter aestuarii]|uniref:histidine kinase dimerization/phospho-acceptor domain-containing protein n=1 Tax=Parerythrobacter aestuarii TaxID=3020909 RepID=UPI0024DE8DF2|nr:histidine kinase dimerization/phospho-acceptor domain-containing protein [Parerythrobacter aestuarii]
MHFDDRLATVLRHRASGERAARTQYRQLLDLLGQRRHGRDESLLAAAWLRLGALGETIPAIDRAAIVREPSWRFRNPELAAHLAEDQPAVAAAALASAHLDEDDWEALIPRLPIRARGFLRLRRDLPDGAMRVLDRLGVSDRALPLPTTDEPLVLTEEADPESEERPSNVMPFPANDAADQDPAWPKIEPETDPELVAEPTRGEAVEQEQTPIAALVERIEAFQRSRNEARQAPATAAESDPHLPFIELEQESQEERQDGLVFTTDAEGRIDWAEEHVAPMLRYLGVADILPRAQQLAWQRRLPLASVAVTLEGAPSIAGTWYLDAAPRFDPLGGRFVGYAARLRRASGRDDAQEESSESDRIRQLLHELRTPVNAIQGFAEVIQQQLFGPVPHEYRAHAAAIAGDAARILAGFDELDRLAKLESGVRELEEGEANFSAIVAGQLKQLGDILKPRNAGFASKLDKNCSIALAHGEAEALSWRILAALAASLAPGETLRISLKGAAKARGEALQLQCDLPEALKARDDIFAAATAKAGGTGLLTPGSFGSGFALRLARAEARSAGGSMARVDDRLTLTLPLLTAAEADSSPEGDATTSARPGVS